MVHKKAGLRIFRENFDLNVTAQELDQQPDLQQELLENSYSQYSELSGRMEKYRYNLCLKAQQLGNQVARSKINGVCVDDLLILAQSAETVALSEDNVADMQTNNQKNKGLHSDLVDQMSQECASNIDVNVTRTHLSQIRKQARCKFLRLDKERAEDSHCKSSQGKTVRLNQIKHQARCKRKNDLSPQMITGPRNEQPKDRILRLSQMKHKARSKGYLAVKKGTENHVDQSLPCNSFKGNENVITRQFVEKYIRQRVSNPPVEGVPAHNFYRGANQSFVVWWDFENVKEHQRTARRLRAFKTKKLRQLLRSDCKRNYASVRLHDAMRTNLIGLTAANSEAQKEFIPVKRLRLTQFKREARLGNHNSAMQGLPGN